ncbi:MAG: dipeptidyl peptidase 3 [Bacteroidetes bacterium]|nr:dipeptidyl peptidase 3 [Bacteroidota bacterium]
MAQKTTDFNYHVDRFADIEVLRYQVPGFEKLSLQQKKYIYYLSQAAVAGRDILFDQNNDYNLEIRKILETMYLNYKGDRTTENFKQFEIYLKQVWFANGIHHHYSTDKFVPKFSKEFFIEASNAAIEEEFLLSNIVKPRFKEPMITKRRFLYEIISIIFDPTIYAKRVNQAIGEDLIRTSANNYYFGVTQKQVEDFYNAKRNPKDKTPISYGLNSQLSEYIVIKNGKYTTDIQEYVWKIGGMYSKEIEQIVFWLEKAKSVAENDKQKEIITLLIDFYTTGDLKTFDDYSIAWVKDTHSHIDFINGFIETYGDPLGIKASWESIVNFKNIEASRRTEIMSANAQWFEDNSPVDKRFKKDTVKGVSAKVITVAMLGGDCYPATPIGINLPNSNWIREMHGSKSVTIDNITDAYDKASQGTGFGEEFMYSQVEIDRRKKYGKLGDDLHTDLHECLGHGSGKLLPGVSQDALKAYGAPIEEARADLFALYYLADPKMVELGLLPDNEAYKAEYYGYIMNGLLTQPIRIELGKDIEQAHMRNRAMVARWVLANKNLFAGASPSETVPAVEMIQQNGKTFVKVNDYEQLRKLFGTLLTEIQRIKSEGDYEAAKKLIETYGIKIDPKLHAEVLERYKKLNLAPYKGFINPVYTPVLNEKGEIIDISIDYSEGYVEQMLRYGKN